MKHFSKIVTIKRAISRIFGASKANVTLKNRKEDYFRCYWFPKNLCRGIEIIAEFEHSTLRNAVVQLMKDGLSSYMGDKVTEQIKLDNAARERNEKAKRTRFAFILRKYARAKGLDISKFI